MQFTLQSVPVDLFLGVPAAERAHAQQILLDLTWEYDTQAAAVSDDIQDTIDYFTLRQWLQAFPGDQPWCLLERLHAAYLHGLQTDFPNLKNVCLTITKFPFAHGSIQVKNIPTVS